MRTLLDNSTLTGAFRALGLIKDASKELFDLDVAALRILIESIVLSKEIFILDQYKEEYSKERKSWLNYDPIIFKQIPERLDNRMLSNARAHVFNWHLSQNLATEFNHIFDDLNLLFRHAWRNSESFLVLRALGVENKYNSLIARALISQITPDSLELKTLRKMDARAYNKETLRVAQSLSWAAVRAVYYREAAKLIGCEYNSHPLRNLFNLKCILFDNHPATRTHKKHSSELKPSGLSKKEELSFEIKMNEIRRSYYNDLNSFFKNFWQDCNEKDKNIFDIATYDIELPPFFSLVLKRSDTWGLAVLESAFKLRESPEASAIRRKLDDIYGTPEQEQQNVKLRELAVELRELKKAMQIYLGYDRERVPIQVKAISYELTVPRFMTKPYYPSKPHLAFIRDVILELTAVSTIGRQIDYLRTKKS